MTDSTSPSSPFAGVWTRRFALFCGVFLLTQGATTFVARLVPTVDRLMPWLLATTHMMPLHSLVHIATGLLAFVARWLGPAATWRFALAFGGFYATLGVVGQASGHHLGLHLQAFDHPFHILLGVLGLTAAWRDRVRYVSSTRL